MSSHRHLTAAIGLVLLAVWPSPRAAADELSEQEQRGRAIYLEGRSPSGAEIVALVGPARTEVPATLLPCGSCHGADGHGQPRAAMGPADLTWPVLTRPLEPHGASRRQRPAYAEPLVKRAITRGLDAAGRPLQVVMPRYRLTRRDSDDLIAYLRRLGAD